MSKQIEISKEQIRYVYEIMKALPSGEQIGQHFFTWTNGLVNTYTAKDANGNRLFTMTFTWNGDGTLNNIVRG